MRLDDGWNQIQFNLSDFTRRAYGKDLCVCPLLLAVQLCVFLRVLTFLASCFPGTNYIETLRVQVHANCRIRRIYFSDRLYSEEELP
jgi:hypothetical protein